MFTPEQPERLDALSRGYRMARADLPAERIRNMSGFDAGHDAGWSGATEWIAKNFDVFDRDAEDQDDETEA